MFSHELPSVDVVIRARGHSKLLSTAVNSILSQKNVLSSFIIVNSFTSSSDFSSLANNLVVVPYCAARFNYSEAINIAFPLLKSEYTLVISSHTAIYNSLALQYGVSLLESNPLVAAVNFSDSREGSLSCISIDASSFNGWNGTWNTASLYRTELLKSRPFRPEILSAEDQEWSRWAIEQMGMLILHINGCCTKNLNPRKSSVAKKLKEWEFISAFAYPLYLSPGFILSRLKYSVILLSRFQVRGAMFECMVAFVLIRVRLFGVYSTSSSY
jgi:hypothetical protein